MIQDTIQFYWLALEHNLSLAAYLGGRSLDDQVRTISKTFGHAYAL